jgi:hypothetical protein
LERKPILYFIHYNYKKCTQNSNILTENNELHTSTVLKYLDPNSTNRTKLSLYLHSIVPPPLYCGPWIAVKAVAGVGVGVGGHTVHKIKF